MQQPRRTSEFHEEPSTAKKRRSRQTQRVSGISPAPSLRNGRSTLQIRPSSTDRGGSVQKLLCVPPSSATRGMRGTTPQKTSYNKLPANRVLFSAEKQNNAGNVAMHNNKKWVQERTQRIAAHLCQANINGVSPEFFERTNFLRQITIKQFVSIINYFLRFIWGNRFIVGTNYVDDIVNNLQRLHYPHQLNKSWLKTLNATHSIGNVVVLLDFLMAFVPPNGTEEENEMLFPFDESHESTITNSGNEMKVPDMDFNAQLLQQAKEGFMLWDKQQMDEFSALQQRTCDTLIFKCIGIEGVAALDAEIDQLEKQLRTLEKQRPPIPEDQEKLCQKLEYDLRYKLQTLQMRSDDLETEAKLMKEMTAEQALFTKEIARLENEIVKTQAMLSQQTCTVQQRDNLIEELDQLKHILQSGERTVSALRDKNHSQQVSLSRAKKKLTDEIEKFNAHIQDIEVLTDTDGLQLPFNAAQKDLQCLLPQLHALRANIESKLQEDESKIQQLEQLISQLTLEIDTVLEPKNKSLQIAIAAAVKCLQHLEDGAKEERNVNDHKLQQLEEESEVLLLEVVRLQGSIALQRQEIQRLQQQNEETISDAEQRHAILSAEREAMMDKYEAALKQANDGLENLTKIVEYNDVELKNLKQQLHPKK